MLQVKYFKKNKKIVFTGIRALKDNWAQMAFQSLLKLPKIPDLSCNLLILVKTNWVKKFYHWSLSCS